MTLKIEDIGEKELLCYVDNQLTSAERQVVEQYLALNPDKGGEITEWKRQAQAIKALHDPVLAEPVPERLKPQNLSKLHSAANTNSWRNIAAAAALIVLSTSAGWYARDVTAPTLSEPQLLLSAALNAHEIFTPQTRHAVEVGGDESEHLMQWLSNSLDRSFVMPNSLPDGFQLAGGRLLATHDMPAAQLIYDAGDRRISLYITPRTNDAQNETVFETGTEVAALYWANSAITCTIVGDLSQGEMEAIARKVYESLNWSSDDGWTT